MPTNPKIDFSMVDTLPNDLSVGTVYMSPDISSGFIKVGKTSNSTYTIYDQSNIFRQASDSTLGMIKSSSTYIHDEYMQETAINSADGKIYAKQSDVYYMTPTALIDASSTSQQVPNAKAVYDFITNYSSSHEIGPSLIPAPAVIIDSSNSSVTIDCLYGNKVYIWQTALTSLNINSITDSHYESTLYFTTGNSFSIALPQNTKKLNPITFLPNTSYVLSIKDQIICTDTVQTYNSQQPVVFSSTQLASGVVENPTVIESADTNPVINNTLPNAIYRFGEVSTITMHNIPANSLETLVYFTAGSIRVTLNLDSSYGLKITSGSALYLYMGEYVMSIKDGVIVISELITV